MTLEELLDHSASECIDARESYLIIFTTGLNGYVCKNQGATSESRALFRGTFRQCQIWIEQRGLAAALQYLLSHRNDVPEPALSLEEFLRQISQLKR